MERCINWALQYCMDEYVDWQKSICHFNSTDFQFLLMFASEFPESIDYDKLNENDDALVLQEQ